MGRQHYLERLALGRSPFEALEPDSQAADQNNTTTLTPENQTSEEDAQLYDDKGRPTNPSTEERNQALRNAQNAVLSLVGVVESKDENERQDDIKHRKAIFVQEHILQQENERGEEFELATKVLHVVLTWWPDALISRIQAGMYSFSRSFADIIRYEIGMARSGGLRAWFAVLLPGLPARAVCSLVELVLYGSLAEVASYLSTELLKRTKRGKGGRRLNAALTVMCEMLFAAIDVMLLPLSYHALAQSTGLAPAWPLLPNWRAYLPSGSSSYHNFLWKPTATIPGLTHISSPAALIVLWTLLTRNQDEDYPPLTHFTNYKYPPINAPLPPTRPQLDPLGQIFHTGYLLRSHLLKSLDWTLETFPPQARRKPHQQNHIPHLSTLEANAEGTHVLTHVHRSTALAMQPAKYLASCLDTLFARILTLPIETILLRAVASSYLASNLPRAPLALSRLSKSWGAGGYASSLGLGIALNSAVEVGVFWIVYRLVRWQGLRHCFWGQRFGGIELVDGEFGVAGEG